jgi:oxygen-independent coproporphyrinogen-3 oxidase
MHRYIEALVEEIRGITFYNSYLVRTIYIGGGTPSILQEEDIDILFDTIYKSFKIINNPEITIEVNPGTINERKLKLYRELGINRISTGIQSLQPEELKFLGRIHTSEEAINSIELAEKMGFDNISIDLIYGIPNQTVDSWKATLKQVLDTSIKHISIYGLIYEPGTPLYKALNRGKITPLSEDVELDIFDTSQILLTENGFLWYEISNYSIEGFECKHNLTYWEGGDYLGIGASSHSLIEDERYSNTPNIGAYINLIKMKQSPRVWVQKLLPLDRAKELIILGLRLRKGVLLSDVYKKTGVDILKLYYNSIEKLKDNGLLNFDGNRISLTERGRLLGNLVFEEFI